MLTSVNLITTHIINESTRKLNAFLNHFECAEADSLLEFHHTLFTAYSYVVDEGDRPQINKAHYKDCLGLLRMVLDITHPSNKYQTADEFISNLIEAMFDDFGSLENNDFQQLLSKSHLICSQLLFDCGAAYLIKDTTAFFSCFWTGIPSDSDKDGPTPERTLHSQARAAS